MVQTTCNSTEDHCELVIRTNQSMTWKENLMFLYLASALAMIIALFCAFLGFWLVLPFTGLEITLLTVCLYMVSRRTSVCEVVTIKDDQIIIEKGRRRVEERNVFSRHWVKVALSAPTHQWYASKLMIGSHGKHIEVGQDLIEAERVDLAETLAQLVPMRRATEIG